MIFSEDEKFEKLVLEFWGKRFSNFPVITRKRTQAERADARDQFLDLLKKYLKLRFNVFYLSILLKALIELEMGYKIYRNPKVLLREARRNNNIQFIDRVRIQRSFMDHFKRTGQVSYPEETWGKFKPKKATAIEMRCAIADFFVQESKRLGGATKKKLIFNQNRAVDETLILMELLGLKGESASAKDLANALGRWKKKNYRKGESIHPIPRLD